MSNYKRYWYGFVRECVKKYPDNIGDTEMGRHMKAAIDAALEDTAAIQDGSSQTRLRLIRMLYIDKTHTFHGAIYNLYISERTAQRYISQFMYTVADHAGFR